MVFAPVTLFGVADQKSDTGYWDTMSGNENGIDLRSYERLKDHDSTTSIFKLLDKCDDMRPAELTPSSPPASVISTHPIKGKSDLSCSRPLA